MQRNGNDQVNAAEERRIAEHLAVLFSQPDAYIFAALVFQMMNQPLNLVAFVEKQESGCAFDRHPPVKYPADGVFQLQVVVRSRQAETAGVADDLFVLPQAVAAADADAGVD